MTVSGGIRVRLREDLTAVDECCGCSFGQAASSEAEGRHCGAAESRWACDYERLPRVGRVISSAVRASPNATNPGSRRSHRCRWRATSIDSRVVGFRCPERDVERARGRPSQSDVPFVSALVRLPGSVCGRTGIELTRPGAERHRE